MTDEQRRKQSRKIAELCYLLSTAIKLITCMVPRLDNHPLSKDLEQDAYKLIKSIQDIKKP